jgi:hypothetical protein
MITAEVRGGWGAALEVWEVLYWIELGLRGWNVPRGGEDGRFAEDRDIWVPYMTATTTHRIREGVGLSLLQYLHCLAFGVQRTVYS